MPHRPAGALLVAMLTVLAYACGSGSDLDRRAQVTIEPLPSATARAAIPVGGKPLTPAIPPTPAATDTPEPESSPAEQAPTEDEPTATHTPTPTTTAEPAISAQAARAPEAGRWIDVDVTAFVVRLMDGDEVVQEIGPVAVGEQVDTGEYASTQTGLFHVYNKIEDLAYDPPYDTYISHWVGFDPEKANGFHSFLKDENGKIIDSTTGRVSNGCIRTGDAEAIFAFAEEGMPVWVHA